MGDRMQEKYVLKKSVKKVLYSIIILLVGMIITKNNPELKETIKEKLFEKSLPMTEARNIYEKYFSMKKKEKETPVWNEKIPVQKEEKTEKGVKLVVLDNTPIPNLESGIISYVDQNKIIMEQVDGVVATYSNVETKDYKLYDYLEKGEILGTSSSKEVIISFTKEGEYYDYKKYL